MQSVYKIKDIVLIILISGFSFAFVARSVTQQDSFIMMGIAYSKSACGGADFSSVVGWRTMKGSGNKAAAEKRIREELNNDYGKKGITITILTGHKKVGVLLRYEKEISGGNCKVIKYTPGFGNTYEEAHENALKVKNDDSPTSTAGVVSKLYN